jgi:tryptophan synthase alpha chain
VRIAITPSGAGRHLPPPGGDSLATSGICAALARAKAEGRPALVPFVTAGYPNLAMTERLLPALVEGGADVIEIGIPFSDPIADGVTVQRTSQVALANGTTLEDAIAVVSRARANGITTPIVFMGYFNPFYHYGIERLAKAAAAAGVDGFIIPDLPTEESDDVLAALRANGRDLIFLVAPTSTEDRIREVAKRASGFVYCVSLTGVTGARASLADDLPTYIERVRRHTDLPLVVGFGISKPEHVQEVGQFADGVVIASALINHLEGLPQADQPSGATAFLHTITGR